MLPNFYMITGENPNNTELFLQNLSACIDQGIHLIQLRAKHLSSAEYLRLYLSAAELCHQRGVILLANCPLAMVPAISPQGLHLTHQQLLACEVRPLTADKIIAASCHNEQALLHAAKLKLNFVTLSPVLSTQSHPGARTLGWSQFKNLVSTTAVPVYALGGLCKADLIPAKINGACGIAAISGLWNKTK